MLCDEEIILGGFHLVRAADILLKEPKRVTINRCTGGDSQGDGHRAGINSELGNELIDHMTMHICQSAIDAIFTEGKALMVDA